MPVGNVVTAGEFNRVVGQLCRQIESLALAVEDVKAVIDTKTAAQWATQTGIAEVDINDAISAVNDLVAVVNAYQGESALTQADRRVFVRRCRGLSSLI